ncbi:UNVERIFIED_CONTAM: hypothetical protein FKN15_023352 [Acipenser sinensis]
MQAKGNEMEQTSTEPTSKKPKEADDGTTKPSHNLCSIYDEILEESTGGVVTDAISSSVMLQKQNYMSEPILQRSGDKLKSWETNKGCFPILAESAWKFLSAPCSSVDSERLFSAALHIVDEKRNRLMCEKAEMLLFVKKNLPLTHLHKIYE